MKSVRSISAIGAVIAALALAAQPAHADGIRFTFAGNGFSGSGILTTVLNVSPPDPNPDCGTVGNNPCRQDPEGAYKITGITGTFTSAENNIFGAAITGLVPINPTGERGPIFDPLVPASESWYDAPSGDPDLSMSYSNLYYPAGSPVVCADFTNIGSLLDVYGMAFTVDGGYTAVLWGDGDYSAPGTVTYGMKLTDGKTMLVNQFAGVTMSTVPEPSTLVLVGIGMLGMLIWRKRSIAA